MLIQSNLCSEIDLSHEVVDERHQGKRGIIRVISPDRVFKPKHEFEKMLRFR